MKSRYLSNPIVSYFLAFLFVISNTGHLFAVVPATAGIETKMAIETRLEERLRRVLTEITGTEKLIVIVSAQLYTEKEEKKESETLLPGVPVKKKIGEEAKPLDLADIKTLVRKLTVTIILDKAISTKVIEVVKEVTTGLVGLDPERGDQIIIQQMSFEKNPFFWGSLFYPPHLYWVIAIILGGLFIGASTIFLFGPFKIFATNIVTAIQTAGRREETREEAHERELPLPVINPVLQQEIGISGSSRPFSFLKEEHLRNLLFLVRKENPENIAIVINYLPANFSSEVFSSLSSEIQTQVATNLAKISEMDPQVVRNVEEKIKTQIEYLIGGEEWLSEMLNYADRDTQERILTALREKDSELAQRVKGTFFTFEDIATFEPQIIQAIYRRTNPVAFAQILKTTAEEVKNKVLSSLTAGAGDRLRQEMELSRPLTPKRLEQEKHIILNLIRQLVREGIIEITKRG